MTNTAGVFARSGNDLVICRHGFFSIRQMRTKVLIERRIDGIICSMVEKRTRCFFVSDIHGSINRYEKLFDRLVSEPLDVLFIGGDILPHMSSSQQDRHGGISDFVTDYLAVEFARVRRELGESYPTVFLILGNDDGRAAESSILRAEGIWTYVHDRKVALGEHSVYGYAYVPPTPFLLKDWERYDVSRYVDPGTISPEDGFHSSDVSSDETRYSTIQKDLEQLTGDADLSKSVMLFHTPPYRTNLDHIPSHINVGSKAVRQFIETQQPLLTLHGHIHESPRLTGSWRDLIGETHMFSAAHDGPELALVRFDLENLDGATRELI